MTVYFQHWTGEIRWIQLNTQGKWIGGGKSEVIATDAKNATPISTVAYSVNATTMVCIFSNLTVIRMLNSEYDSGTYSISTNPIICAKSRTAMSPTYGRMVHLTNSN